MKAAIFDSSVFRFSFPILFFLLSGAHIDIQAQRGYYLIDPASHIGVKIVDGGPIQNSAYCTVKTISGTISFTPDEVREYGFDDGRVYVAKTIVEEGSAKKVFLERLSMGRLVLYYYHGSRGKTFYIETVDGQLSELPREDNQGNSFRHNITEYTADFPEGFDAIKDATYSRNAMLKLFDRYERRDRRPFPHFRYGVTLSYGLTELVPQARNIIMGNTSFRKDGSFSAGVFVDQPLFLSDYSLNAGINISKQMYAFDWTSEDGDEDFYAKSASVGIPLLLRYSWHSNRFRPFLNAGGLAVWNVSNHNILYRNTFVNNSINLEIDRTLYISDFYTGFSAGAGIEYRLLGRGSVLTEVRYSMLWPSEKPHLINMKVLNITMGYSF